MKKITGAILILTTALAWVSCTKKTNSSPDVIQPAGLHASINGAAWTPMYVNKVTSTGGGHYSIEIDGTDSATSQTLTIELPDFTGKGVHTITATSADMGSYATTDSSYAVHTINATSGQITITAVNDSAVSGTFNFTAGSQTITDGTFNINF